MSLFLTCFLACLLSMFVIGAIIGILMVVAVLLYQKQQKKKLTELQDNITDYFGGAKWV